MLLVLRMILDVLFSIRQKHMDESSFLGHNEQLLGKAIKPFRNNVVVATKLHISSEEYFEEKNLYNIIRHHLEESKNLRTDYVDLYYLHRYNKDIGMEPVAEVMGKYTDTEVMKNLSKSRFHIIGEQMLKVFARLSIKYKNPPKSLVVNTRIFTTILLLTMSSICPYLPCFADYALVKRCF